MVGGSQVQEPDKSNLLQRWGMTARGAAKDSASHANENMEK